MAFQGVNLGGWLVLERWITPAVFAGTDAQDEYSLCASLDPDEAVKRLETHRASFITRDHVRQLAAMGLKMIRLPVGYWLFEVEKPFVAGADTYVDRLFEWADEFGLQVILDVHAAPGSQNGWDHSGRAGEMRWLQGDNVQTTLQFVKRLARRYGQQPSLFGIEVLNEPHWDIPLDALLDYYRRSQDIIDTFCPARIKMICSDAFRPEQMSKLLAAWHSPRLVLDIHLYQLFTPEDQALDLHGHLKKASGEWSELLMSLSKRLPVMVGEWSAAMDERGQTYVDDDYVRYFKTQRVTFDDLAVGWTYWTARTQNDGAWSLLDHPEFL